MSLLDKTADKAQLIDILNSMKFPIMGAGGGFAPIGTINFFDASIAPQGWLACDGSTYNIADYHDLAIYYASVHGASNYYGGNGTTTFAVPDLRGEFLRGSGTNSHANQGSGANVGVHQDGTEMPQNYTSENVGIMAADTSWQEADTTKTLTTKANVITLGTAGGTYGTVSTTRPTNTSFLICVKATLSDAHLDSYKIYSPNEHQVGWWQEEIDGVLKQKKVYEKTLFGLGITTKNSDWVTIGTYDYIEKIVGLPFTGFSFNGGSPFNNMASVIEASINNSTHVLQICTVYARTIDQLTIQYTKTTDQWQTS